MSKGPVQLRFARHHGELLDVRSFSIRDRINELWSISIRATIETGAGGGDLPFDSIIDAGAAFWLETSGRPGVRIWSGICSEISHESEHQGGDSAACVYSLTLVPELWRLTLRRNSRIFQHESIPQIVLRLLKDWRLEEGSQVLLRNLDKGDTDRFPVFEYRVQYEETDYAFMCRLLEEAGISFYFEFDNAAAAGAVQGRADLYGRDLVKLVLDADPQIAEEAGEESAGGGGKTVVGPLPYLGAQARALDGRPGSAVASAGAARYVKPGAVTVLDHDFRNKVWEPRGRPKQTDQVANDKTSEAKYEVLAYVPGALQREQSRPEGNKYVEDKGSRRAKDALRGVRHEALVTQFQTNALAVCSGSVVQFGDVTDGIGHPRAELKGDKKHLVIETRLDGDATAGWHVSCWAVPADPDQPYRPPQDTPKPRIFGVQSALIVGDKSSAEEQIHCDKYGRVRVQFHWDRQHKYGDPSAETQDPLGSCWVRVATPWAGARYGFVAIPRVGHEVLISFLDGDPDQPMIVGSLYNGPNMPPYDLGPDQPGNTMTGLKSNTSTGGKGFNELYFDDKKGAERIHVQAQKNMSTVVKNAETRDVGATRTTKIGKTDTLHVGKVYTLAVGPNQTGIQVAASAESLKQDRALLDGSASESSAAESNPSGTPVIVMQVGGPEGATISLIGPGIYLNAKSDIHLHAGTDIHLSAKGNVNIDGGFIYLNCKQPEAVTLPAYPTAAAPAPGAFINAGPKPEGGGGMPKEPGALAADVHFESIADDEEGADPASEGSEDEAGAIDDEFSRAPVRAPAAAAGPMGERFVPQQPTSMDGVAPPDPGRFALPPNGAPNFAAAVNPSQISGVVGAAAVGALTGGPKGAMAAAGGAIGGAVIGNVVQNTVGPGLAGGVVGTVAQGALSSAVSGGGIAGGAMAAAQGVVGNVAGNVAGNVVGGLAGGNVVGSIAGNVAGGAVAKVTSGAAGQIMGRAGAPTATAALERMPGETEADWLKRNEAARSKA